MLDTDTRGAGRENGEAQREEEEMRKFRWLPYRDVPAILLGRLAVDKKFRGRGLGEALLADALDRALEFHQYVACRYVIVDAYAATQQMFIDLRTVEAATSTGNG